MKKLLFFIRSVRHSIKMFLRPLTKKGREAQMYDKAMENMAINDVPRRVLKAQIDTFLNKDKGIRRLPPDAKERQVMNKYGKQMEKYNLKLDPFSKKLIHA